MNHLHRPAGARFLHLWVAGASAVFLLMTLGLLTGRLAPFDSWVYSRVAACISPRLTGPAVFITHLGGDRVLITAAVVVFLFLWKKQSLITALVTAAILPLSSLVNTAMKYLFLRQRPSVLRLVEIGGYSFPSGHSFVSMSFYGLLIVLALHLLPRGRRLWLCLPLGALIAAIGLSRIYLGVHYASDVLAGLCGGFVWLTAYRRGATRLWPRLPL